MTTRGALLEANVTDDRLVAAVRDGDDRAFEALFARYRPRVGGFIAGMVGDHDRAEDVTQEVFVAALRRMRATERPIAFKPWIYEIARNACIDEFRRTRRFSGDVSFDAEAGGAARREADVAASTSADAALQAKQQLDDLCGAFGGLSDAHHEILVLRELEGLSYRQIGDRLGLSRASVESTLFRARRRLTEEYEDLVSGERCRKVSELLAKGAASLGIREERRLARHVAHCQPCRRAAYAAGVDAATLTRHRRRDLARRVAGVIPVPAFLRFSQIVGPAAEPAAGWTKAVAAAVVLAAGGAGVAAHDGTGGSERGTPAPASSQPVSPVPPPAVPAREHEPARAAPAVEPVRRVSARAPTLARTVKARTRSQGPNRGTSARQPTAPAKPSVPAAPATPGPNATQPASPRQEPPAGASSTASGAVSAGSRPVSESASRAAGSVPAVTPPVSTATNAVSQVSKQAGAAVPDPGSTATARATNAVGQVDHQAGAAVDETLEGTVGGLVP